MQRILGLIWVCALSAAATFAQTRDVHYQGDHLTFVPAFDHGYLVAYRGKQVDVFSPEGTFLYTAAAQAPGSDWSSVLNAAVDSDGTMALAVRTMVNPGFFRGGGIALFDPAGRQIRYFDDGDYLPAHVAFGPDHSLWTVGWVGDTVEAATRDYPILRHFAPDGHELGAFLPRSTFPYSEYAGDPQPLVMPIVGDWEIRVVNGSVEVILWREKLWVQADLNGAEKHRWQIGSTNGPGELHAAGPLYRPSAITDDGRAWRKEENRLKQFDRSTGVWNPVAFEAPNGTLLGADGDDLVFLLNDGHTVRRVSAPSGHSSMNRQFGPAQIVF